MIQSPEKRRVKEQVKTLAQQPVPAPLYLNYLPLYFLFLISATARSS
jgi:hypothetical protein